jgi:hypothetical protein
MYYHELTNTYIDDYAPFELEGIQYPSGWLLHLTLSQKTDMGLQEVVTVGHREDDKFFYVHEELSGATRTIINIPKDPKVVQDILQKEYITALENFYDSKARERQYDTRYTCALRAGYAGPFQAEGLAFAAWMDNCNHIAYSTLAEVEAGTKLLPTKQEFIDSLPSLVWP